MTGPGPPPWGNAAAEFRAAATRAGRQRLGACALEGTRLFERALRAEAGLRGVLVSQAVLDSSKGREGALLTALRAAGIAYQAVPGEAFRELTGGRDLGGFAGLAALPEPWRIQVPSGGPALLLGAVGLDDPGNVGALARTAHASGAAGLVLVNCTDAFHPRAVRTSMGSLFRLPVAERSDLARALVELREEGWKTYGAVSSGGVQLPEVEISGAERCAAFVGSEAFGLEPSGLDGFQELVTIPMTPGVDSYSVNAAAAVMLYGLGAARAPSR